MGDLVFQTVTISLIVYTGAKEEALIELDKALFEVLVVRPQAPRSIKCTPIMLKASIAVAPRGYREPARGLNALLKPCSRMVLSLNDFNQVP